VLASADPAQRHDTPAMPVMPGRSALDVGMDVAGLVDMWLDSSEEFQGVAWDFDRTVLRVHAFGRGVTVEEAGRAGVPEAHLPGHATSLHGVKRAYALCVARLRRRHGGDV